MRCERHVLALLFTTVVSACSVAQPADSRDAVALSSDTSTVITLRGRPLIGGAHLGRSPEWLGVSGGSLIVLSPGSDSAVRVFDATTGRLEGGVGDNGSRPGEFVGAWSVDPVAGHADSFWVYDVSLHRLTRVDLRRRPGAAPSFQLTPVDLVTDAAVLYAARAAGGGFAALGMFNTARIAFFDSAGKLTRLPPGSPPGSDTIAVSVGQHAYQSRMRPNADRSRWALAARNAGRLEVYDSSGSLVAEAKVPFRFEPKYLARVRRGTALMSSGRDLRVGYVDVATTENLIFALFSGRTGVSHGMGRSSFGEYVHVFDWDGALRGVLRLDGAEASSIAVDERGTTLYALRQYPSRSVIAYPVEGALPPGIAPAPSVGYAGRHSDH